jgi:hypothetical protein
MSRNRIEIYWKKAETAPDGVIAQVRVTDGSGSDYLLPYPCKLTTVGWVNAGSGKPLAVGVTYWNETTRSQQAPLKSCSCRRWTGQILTKVSPSPKPLFS